MQLPYLMRTVGEGSPTRDQLSEEHGPSSEPPVLEDSNVDQLWTGSEWQHAIKHLSRTYGAGETLRLWAGPPAVVGSPKPSHPIQPSKRDD